MGIRSLKSASISTGTKRSKVWDQSAALPLPSSYESIATVTPSGSDVTFSSIPSTYKHLQIRVLAKSTRSDASVDTMYLRFNGDTGSTYNVHTMTANGSSAQFSAYPGTTIWGTWDLTDAQSQANTFAASIVDILDYSDTNKYTTTKAFGGSDKNGSGGIGLFSGLWRNTAAVSSIRIFAEGNYVAGSSFALYGIKG